MNFEEELAEISTKIHVEESQLRLQHLLTEKTQQAELGTSRSQEILKNISASLTKSLLESKIYHLINTAKSQHLKEENLPFSKSVLDLNGDFIWHDKSAEKIFQFSSQTLMSSNIFSLMSPCSVRYLYSKYSQELLVKSKIVMSYILSNGVELSSRCSLIRFSSSFGCYQRGVLLETRLSRHKVLNYNSLSISPLIEYSENNLLFTPIVITPTAFGNNEMCVIDLEHLRITPFLKNDSPCKRRKIGEGHIPDF